MIALLLFGFAAAQVALVLVQPIALVYLSLLTGGVPLKFGQEGMAEGDFGRMNPSRHSHVRIVDRLGILGVSPISPRHGRMSVAGNITYSFSCSAAQPSHGRPVWSMERG